MNTIQQCYNYMIVYNKYYLEIQEVQSLEQKCKKYQVDLENANKIKVHLEYKHNKALDNLEPIINKYCDENEKLKFKNYYFN